jgi:hypothetical protein
MNVLALGFGLPPPRANEELNDEAIRTLEAGILRRGVPQERLVNKLKDLSPILKVPHKKRRAKSRHGVQFLENLEVVKEIPANRDKARHLAKKLYVFDFDLTVLKVHTSLLRLPVQKVAARALSDVADGPFFFAFVGAVLARGGNVAIASFGQKEVIREYLKYLLPPFHKKVMVFTPNDVSDQNGHMLDQGKNDLIRLACQEVGIVPHPEDVCFVDDEKTNCDFATDSDVATVFCCPFGGLTAAHWISMTENVSEPLNAKNLRHTWQSSIAARTSKRISPFDIHLRGKAQELWLKDLRTNQALYAWQTDTQCTVGTAQFLSKDSEPFWNWKITLPLDFEAAFWLFFGGKNPGLHDEGFVFMGHLLAAQIFMC